MRTPELTFDAVNDFVNRQDAMYEELQGLCLTLAGKLETANKHLYYVINSDVGAQARYKLENGQGTNTTDGQK